MSKRSLWMVVAGVVVVLIAAGFFIPKETQPSSDTRVILEHSFQTYIAPGQQGCFEQAEPEPTNYLEDATLGEALELDYNPHDACTEESLESETEPFIISVLRDIGILSKKWDEW
jgi:hypothetical protein